MNNNRDREQFALLMGEMGVAFNSEVTFEMIAVYFKHLCDLDLGLISIAVNKAIKNCDKFPSIKNIREFASENNMSYLTIEQSAAIRRTLEAFNAA